MGEEEKKEEKVEEVKKVEEAKKEEVKEEKKQDDKKVDEEAAPAPPPPPPPVIVLRVYMHCEGCARKVRACLKGFPGVEGVETDCKSHKVVVKGEKADPIKVLERVQRKSHRQVELLSPIPKPPEPAAEEPKAAEVKEAPKPEEKKAEPQVITVVLKVHMHCEACAQEIKKRIMRMKGVENAEPDLINSQVTVKGVFEAPKLVEYVYKRTGKHAVVVKQDPPEKKEDKEEKKGDEGGDKDKEAKKGEEAVGDGKEKKEGGGEETAKPDAAATAVEQSEDAQVLDMKKHEFYYYHPQSYHMYPPTFTAESYSSTSYPPAPQMFSDENPNACSVM
ncbi:heavy metal-associated isoprenylated plant protein 7 [Daucus carota subsp. sativus]|uniref:heavy metal-associated isoprenylated plant protein 7 n=1 Tax=Daucus carota subsp. sativus TaxID=79200 RepID=UPI0007B2FB93|nr:PREDICTED: heavy metal-associated isoprenylated plant protein 3-like [Daucus carota subsp. sativus]